MREAAAHETLLAVPIEPEEQVPQFVRQHSTDRLPKRVGIDLWKDPPIPISAHRALNLVSPENDPPSSDRGDT